MRWNSLYESPFHLLSNPKSINVVQDCTTCSCGSRILSFVPDSTFPLLSLYWKVNISPNITGINSLSFTQREPPIYADIYKNFTNKKALTASTSLRTFVLPRNIWKSRFSLLYRYIKCQEMQDSLFRDADCDLVPPWFIPDLETVTTLEQTSFILECYITSQTFQPPWHCLQFQWWSSFVCCFFACLFLFLFALMSIILLIHAGDQTFMRNL